MTNQPESFAQLTAAERAQVLAQCIQDGDIVPNSDGTYRVSARAVLKYGGLRNPRRTLKVLFYILKDRVRGSRS